MLTINAEFRYFVLAVTAWLFSLGCAPNGLAAQTNGCLPADTVFVPMHLDYFKKLVSSTAPSDSTIRARLGIPKASASKVSLVTSRTTCVNAVSALNTKLSEPNAARQVWVFALGGGDYAVQDPAMDKKGAEWTPVFIFDRKFSFKNTLVGW